MRLLVLGGTRFLGRGIVDAALANGDQVTTFTRGKSGEPPDGVEALHGDRNAPDGMDVLRGREWDAVIDTSGFVPTVVGRGAALLADSVGHSVFVSSLNAYPSFGDEPIRDDSPVHDCAADAGSPDGEFELEQYGPFKVGSERAVDRHFAGRSAHLRAGLIIGPYDASGRFPYWVDRMARGGEVLAPGRPDIDIRLVDARDLGAWAVDVARARTTGAYVRPGRPGR
jgi:2'-hydroxyisoflavone reductase